MWQGREQSYVSIIMQIPEITFNQTFITDKPPMKNQLKGGKVYSGSWFQKFYAVSANSIVYRSVERQRCDGASLLTSCSLEQKKRT